MEEIKRDKISKASLSISLLAFFLFVVYVLYINQEVLYTAHDRSEFLYGAPFFHTLMSKPFGLMQYVGAWLTQLFCDPALGAAVLMAVWILVFYIGTKAFKLLGSASALMLLPVACLLASVVDLGYWVYALPIRGYWFSQSAGYLLMLLLLWAARSTPRKWHLIWYLLGFCVYPVLGWYALLFILCLGISGKLSWREPLGLLLMLFTAGIWHTQLYPNLNADDVVLAGMPRFVTASGSSAQLSLPFWVLGAVSVLLSVSRELGVRSRESGVGRRLVVPVLSVVAGIAFTWTLMFHDKNYMEEMRMVRYAESDNWKEVLKIAAGNKEPTTSMVFLKNIALMNEGGLLDRSFRVGNISYPVYTPDSLHVSFLNIVSPLAYYNYGLMNDAIRLSYENAIQCGFSPFYLKVLSRCAHATGDKKLLERYVTVLHHHPFYAEWQPAPVTKKVREMQHAYPDEITGTENSDSYIVNSISFWYESNSRTASEQALFYAMLSCAPNRFWPSLRNFVKSHINEGFPVHAQEAYILFIDKFPEEKRMMLPVEEAVYNRYKKFCDTLVRQMQPGKTIGQVAGEMRGEWGDTYWYYHYFGRQYSNSGDRKENEVQS